MREGATPPYMRRAGCCRLHIADRAAAVAAAATIPLARTVVVRAVSVAAVTAGEMAEAAFARVRTAAVVRREPGDEREPGRRRPEWLSTLERRRCPLLPQ